MLISSEIAYYAREIQRTRGEEINIFYYKQDN
jgi:hypothetical protein